MMRTKMFFTALLLLMAAGNAYGGITVRWDTVYQCQHSGPIYGMAFIPNTDRFYASYNIGNGGEVFWIDTLHTLCEFTDITGDTLRSIAKFTYDYTLTDLIAINDTNYLVGYDGRYKYRKINKNTGANEEIYYEECDLRKTQNISEENCIFFGTSKMELIKLSMDSLKVVQRIISIPEPDLPHPLWYKPIVTGFDVSPSGKYIFISSNFDYSQDPEMRCSANYILDMRDFSIYRKFYYKDWKKDFKNDTLNYRTSIFSDDDSKIAMKKKYNDSIIDIYDVNSLELLRRVKTIGFNTSFQFDSTGNYLIVIDWFEDSYKSYMYYYNVSTGEIDYFSYGNFPSNVQRQYFTDIFRNKGYSSKEWRFEKYRIYTNTSDIDENQSNSLTTSYSDNNLYLNSSLNKTITNMKIVDIRGNEVYSSRTLFQTPSSINVQLLSGAYYLIVSVDGNNEFYKLIVN